jgi:endoglucanase
MARLIRKTRCTQERNNEMKLKHLAFCAPLFLCLALVMTCQPRPLPVYPPAGFSKAINMGNYLEAPNEGEWTGDRVIDDGDFVKIHDAGFDSVRIPIRWSNHALTASPYTIDSSFMDRVAHVVDASLQVGLTTVINIHHYNDASLGGNLMADPSGQHARFLSLWTQIATHFKDYDEHLYFELLNEPTNEAIKSVWNQYLEQARQAVRNTGGKNDTRIIIIGPTDWNSSASLSRLVIPTVGTDPNIIVTFHYYSPFLFTHQGAEWVTPSPPCGGEHWSSGSGGSQVTADLDAASYWAASHGRALFLGEFGTYGKCIPMNERAAWTAYIREQAESFGIAWAYWEFNQGFGAYDQNADSWRPDLLSALIP